MTVRIAKIVLPLAVIAGGSFWMRNKITKLQAACLLGLIAVFTVIANTVAGLVPPLTDSVTLTALGEKNEGSQGYEIVIDGFEIDGEKYLVDQVIEGKWIWRGDQYMWRPETDQRQPEGVTRTVVLGVPVGWLRTIQFVVNECRGVVEVSAGGVKQKVDTASNASVSIGRSGTTLLILSYLRVLIVYSVVFFLETSLLLWKVYRYIKIMPGGIKEGWQKDRFSISLFTICLAAFFAMMYFCGNKSLWQDEMAMIAYITDTESIFKAMLTDCAWPPAWKGIMYLWYRVVPYGERWLRLLSELCFAAAIYFVGLCGKKVANGRVGIVAAILAATHATLISRTAADICCYSFLFMLSAILLYLYFGRFLSKQAYSWKELIPLTVTMVMIAYTHYFGFFLCGTLFLIDCVYYLRKKIPYRYLMAYLIGGILYAPWLYYIVFVGNALSINYWQPEPTLSSVLPFLNALSGDIPIRYYAFVFGLIMFSTAAVMHRDTLKKHAEKILLMIIPVTLFTGVFMYGKFIAVGNTFWVWNYFTVIVPCLTILVAVVFETMFSLLVSNGQLQRQVIAYSLLVFTLLYITEASYKKIEQNGRVSRDLFREDAVWLCGTEYLYMPSTLIVLETYERCRAPMIEYYITRQGARIDEKDVKIKTYGAVSQEELAQYNQIVILKPINGTFIGADQLYRWLDDSYSLNENKSDKSLRVYVYEKKL